jgi:type VI secretion system protein ImpE
MSAKELFDAGNLQGAIDELTQDVKANPRDVRSRIFLFELLCFAADFQRAQRQLDAVAQTSGDVKVELGTQVYRNVVKAEMARRAFFRGDSRQPKFLSEPPSYVALHIEAVHKLRENRPDELEGLLSESSRLRRRLSGTRDGSPFEDIRDCDDLVAPFLEVLLQQDYVWIPFEQIRNLEIQAPRTLRDLLWIAARLDLTEKPLGDIFIPVQYFGSSEHANDQVRLGRMTDWKMVSDERFVGAGQRMLLIDDAEYPLLEIRKIQFASS